MEVGEFRESLGALPRRQTPGQVSAGKVWNICILHRSPCAYSGAWVPPPHLTRCIFTDWRQAKALAQNEFFINRKIKSSNNAHLLHMPSERKTSDRICKFKLQCFKCPEIVTYHVKNLYLFICYSRQQVMGPTLDHRGVGMKTVQDNHFL